LGMRSVNEWVGKYFNAVAVVLLLAPRATTKFPKVSRKFTQTWGS
jgi:hypothetical protein